MAGVRRVSKLAHPMAVHDGKLYVGVLNPAGVYSYDGTDWTPPGQPFGI